MTVGENLQVYRKLYDCPVHSEEEESWEIRKLLHRYPRELSKGELARVGIFRSLINTPAIWILDEPTANLDDKWRNHLFHHLKRQQAKHDALSSPTCTIIASHDLSGLRDLATRVIVLKQGCVIQDTRSVSEGINFYLSQLT